MERLFEIDLHDYELKDNVFCRPSARGVIPESIEEFGSVLRRQKSNTTPNAIFEQENFYYLCKVEKVLTKRNLDTYEAEAGFILRFVHLDEAIDTNSKYSTKDYFDEIMIKRDTKLLQLIKERRGTDDNILFC